MKDKPLILEECSCTSSSSGRSSFKPKAAKGLKCVMHCGLSRDQKLLTEDT